jgi:hypothetical protein
VIPQRTYSAARQRCSAPAQNKRREGKRRERKRKKGRKRKETEGRGKDEPPLPIKPTDK